MTRDERQKRAAGSGWTNWYINRNRFPFWYGRNRYQQTDLRKVSWRRAI